MWRSKTTTAERTDMLRTEADQTDSLFDLVLPEPLRDLPADLAAIDELLKDDAMLASFRAQWNEEVKAGLIGSIRWGRPTIAIATYVRLMVLKHRLHRSHGARAHRLDVGGRRDGRGDLTSSVLLKYCSAYRT
jgi:hypothetical protein